MNYRKIIVVIVVLAVLLGITACNKASDNEVPSVNLKLSISNLTNDEFESVETKILKNATKNDFKNIQFRLEVKHSSKVKERKIIVPSIKEIIVSKYQDRYWFGEGSSQDNIGENFANYNEKIVFYSKGLDESDIREMLKSAEVKVDWKTSSGDSKEEIFKLEKEIVFND